MSSRLQSHLPPNLPTVSRFLIANGLVGLCAVLFATPPTDAAGPPKVLRDQDAWARFKPGAWKKVRVVTESLDPEGNVVSTSTTDTTTFLESISENCYSLSTTITVEVAGKKFDAEPKLVERGFNGELSGTTSLIDRVGQATFTIDDKKIPCQVYEYSIRADDKKQQNRVYYTANFSPKVVYRASTTTDASGEKTLYETEESLVAVDMPYKVGEQTFSTVHYQTVRNSRKSKTTTLAFVSDEVPGGVIAHTSKELDSSGQLIRRSTLELVDFGLESEPQRRPRLFRGGGIFRRRNR